MAKYLLIQDQDIENYDLNQWIRDERSSVHYCDPVLQSVSILADSHLAMLIILKGCPYRLLDINYTLSQA